MKYVYDEFFFLLLLFILVSTLQIFIKKTIKIYLGG